MIRGPGPSRFEIQSRLIVAVTCVALLVAACGSDDDAGDRAATVSLEDVQTETYTFVDTSRPTNANGDFPGSPECPSPF